MNTLKEIGSAHRPLIFTKCGLTWDGDRNVIHNITADSIRREVEVSLRRLGDDDLAVIGKALPKSMKIIERLAPQCLSRLGPRTSRPYSTWNRNR